MLALTPLASAPLATASAAGLPEISAQAAGAIGIGGGAAVRSDAKAHALATADMPGLSGTSLGRLQLSASVIANADRAVLRVVGHARGTTDQRMALRQGTLTLIGDATVEVASHVAGVGRLLLTGTARGAALVGGIASTTLDLSRHAETVIEVDVTVARGLPLMGGAVAGLQVGGATTRTWAFGSSAHAVLQGVLQARSPVAIDGTAQAAAIAAGALAGGIEAVGRGALVSRVTGRAAGQVAIAPDVQANVYALAHAEMPLPCEGDGIAGVTAEGAGAIGLPVSHDSSGAAALVAAAGGGVGLRGQAVSRGATAAQADRATLSLTGRAAGTILAPRAGAAAGMVQLTGQAQAEATLDALSQAGIGITGATQGASGTHVTVHGCFGVAPDLRGGGDLRGASIGQIGFSVAAAAWTASAGSTSESVVEITGRGAARTKAVAECTVTMALRGAADARLGAIATTTATAIGWIIKASATAPQRAQGQGALALTGAATGAIIPRSTAGGAVALAGAATAITPVRIALVDGAAMTLRGQATGAARTQARSTGRIAVTRLGLGGVQIAGGTARGMAVLGAAQARGMTGAAAYLRLEHELSGTASNLVWIACDAQQIESDGYGIVKAVVMGTARSVDWEVGLACRAFRAPPALRRSELPRRSLSGRLLPTNSGQILRG